MPTTTYWKHRNLELFKTPDGLFKEDSKAPSRALSDWNRQILSGDSCIYFINGTQLSKLQTVPFATVDNLAEFIETNLLSDIKSEADKSNLINLILPLAYQSGILHATSSAMTQRTGQMKLNIALRQPDMKIDFNPASNGIDIIEENQYRKWCDASGRKNHIRTKDQPYYAETKTTYKITPDSVLLTDLTVDCPSRRLAKIFDTRPAEQQRVRSPVFKQRIAQIVEGLFADTRVNIDESASKILYTNK